MKSMNVGKAIKGAMIAAFFALSLVAAPMASAKTLKFTSIIYIPSWVPPTNILWPQPRPPDWGGPLSGDVNGMNYFWETDANFVTGAKGGKVEHYFEQFLITFSDGGWVQGYDNGIFLFANKPTEWKYSAEGRVTAASPDRQSFIGSKFHEDGYVTSPTPDTLIGVAKGYLIS
jgi:hypothetical protein